MTTIQITIVSAIIGFLGTILGAIITVAVAKKYEENALKRKDKLAIFSVLAFSRYKDWDDHDSVSALNSVSIVFYKNDSVIKAYCNYMSACNTETGMPINEDFRNNLLQAMARDLQYTEIDFANANRTYCPAILNDKMEAQKISTINQQKTIELTSDLINRFSELIKDISSAVDRYLSNPRTEETLAKVIKKLIDSSGEAIKTKTSSNSDATGKGLKIRALEDKANE